MDIYTSKEILELEDLYELQDKFVCMGIPFKYKITEAEINWAKFNKGKYSINDWVLKNIDENGLLVFNCAFELEECLQSDGIDHKAVMLSDETALQRLFFWLS